MSKAGIERTVKVFSEMQAAALELRGLSVKDGVADIQDARFANMMVEINAEYQEMFMDIVDNPKRLKREPRNQYT